ncbi:MAG TPA: hypothetical protein VJR89_11680 [Polyangiales bacterium]|nr:hypothetical protein [Polyangiales bacterium]
MAAELSRKVLLLFALGACSEDVPSNGASTGASGSPAPVTAGASPAGAGAASPTGTGGVAAAGMSGAPAGRAAQGGAGSAAPAAGSGGSTPVAAAGSGGAAAGSTAGGAAGQSGGAAGAAATGGSAILPAIENPGAAGPFQVRRVATASGLSSHSLFVPDKPGSEGKYPLVVWTCGNGGTVDFYASFLEHLASHGFFVVADKGSSSDRLAEVESQGDAIDWIFAENDKSGGAYAGKLDVARIAVMGHSLGSLASFGTAGKDQRIRTSVHYSGGLTGNPVGFDMAALKTMTKPAAFLCGGADSTAGPSCQMDFDQAPAMLPVFYGVLGGASHIGPFGGTPRAGEYGRAGVAWLRWQLASDATFASWFTGSDCTLCKSPWTAKQRNLN